LKLNQVEYKSNLDNIFKEMQELKERARLELAQDDP